MAKVDKTQYTKQQWEQIREQRRQEKRQKLIESVPVELPQELIASVLVNNTQKEKIGFVLGNGTSRSPIPVEALAERGKTYGCNALYRTFSPDHLVAVDVKMILEINKAGYQHRHKVWTNPNRSYQNIKNLNYFNPSKGWSSGPTALWLASQHNYEKIFILGFDYRGLSDGKLFNNIYADTANYKRSTEGATFFGNWLRQTASVIKDHPSIQYYRVIASDNYCPEELNKFNNLQHIIVEDFMKMFEIS